MIEVGPCFPTVIFQNNYFGPNSEGGLDFREFMVKHYEGLSTSVLPIVRTC